MWYICVCMSTIQPRKSQEGCNACCTKWARSQPTFTLLLFQQVKGQHSLFTRRDWVPATGTWYNYWSRLCYPSWLVYFPLISILGLFWRTLEALSPAWCSRLLLKQRVLHIIAVIATLLPRFGGDSKDGLLQRLCAAAMAFEGTIVVASSLCSPGAGVLRRFAVFSCVYRIILVFIKSSEGQ